MKTRIKLWLTVALLLACVNEAGAQIHEARPIGNGKYDTAIVVFNYVDPAISLRDLYYTLGRNTSGSHVKVYNASNYGSVYSESMSEYLFK